MRTALAVSVAISRSVEPTSGLPAASHKVAVHETSDQLVVPPYTDVSGVTLSVGLDSGPLMLGDVVEPELDTHLRYSHLVVETESVRL